MRRHLHVAAVLSTAVVMALSTATSACADSGLTAAELHSAVASVPDLPATSDEVVSTGDADSAAVSTVAATTVDIPKDADDGVKLSSAGEQITIGVPDAAAAKPAVVTAPGIVTYPAGGDSANAVQFDESGAVRFLTVIDDADGPEEFQYQLDLPSGSSITKQPDGSLKVDTPAGEYRVAPAWARDANGAHVWTQYFTDGESTIDLVVNHHGEDVAYPITADPWISWGWTGFTVHLSRDETYYFAIGVLAAVAARIGGPAAAFVAAAGGQWLADYARRRGLCLSVFKSYVGLYAYPYVRSC